MSRDSCLRPLLSQGSVPRSGSFTAAAAATDTPTTVQDTNRSFVPFDHEAQENGHTAHVVHAEQDGSFKPYVATAQSDSSANGSGSGSDNTALTDPSSFVSTSCGTLSTVPTSNSVTTALAKGQDMSKSVSSNSGTGVSMRPSRSKATSSDGATTPSEQALALLQSLFPRFNLARAQRRVIHRAAQRHLSVSAQAEEDSVKVEDARLERVVHGWKGCVLSVRHSARSAGASTRPHSHKFGDGYGDDNDDDSEADEADLDSSEEEEDHRAVRTLYVLLPSSSGCFTGSKPHNAEASLPSELREALLDTMDLASETLHCDRLVLAVQADTPTFRSLLHGLCYVGGYVVSYGPRIERAYAASGARSYAHQDRQFYGSIGSGRHVGAQPTDVPHSRGLPSGGHAVSSPPSSEDVGEYDAPTLVASSESEYEGSTMGLPGVQGLVPAPELVLVAVDL